MTENWAMIIVAIVTLAGTFISVYINMKSTKVTVDAASDDNQMTLTNELVKLLMESKVEGIDTVLKINEHLEINIARLRNERDELQLKCTQLQCELDKLSKE